MNLSKVNQDMVRRMSLLEAVQALDGYYECPTNNHGYRLGPLVGYAGRDEKGRQFVGDIYLNMAVLEEYPHILWVHAGSLVEKLSSRRNGFSHLSRKVFCGAPLGGMALAQMVAMRAYGRYLFPEKEVLDVATHLTREKSRLVFKRHEVDEGDEVIIVEDVCNNFSTTNELITLINRYGATVDAIVCLLNRAEDPSLHGEYHYGKATIPIIALEDKPIRQYRQDDLLVLQDVENGNVVWKPKDKWAELMDAMNAHSSISL